MYLELDRHFSFWSEKFHQVQEQATRSLETLNNHQHKDRGAFTDLQQNLHSLMPKVMKQVQENKEIEMQLLNANK